MPHSQIRRRRRVVGVSSTNDCHRARIDQRLCHCHGLRGVVLIVANLHGERHPYAPEAYAAGAVDLELGNLDLIGGADDVRRRRGELTEGDEGLDMVNAADRSMVAMGIDDPKRITAVLAPPAA